MPARASGPRGRTGRSSCRSPGPFGRGPPQAQPTAALVQRLDEDLTHPPRVDPVQPVGPFDRDHAMFQVLVETEIVQLGGVLEAVEVDMGQGWRAGVNSQELEG